LHAEKFSSLIDGIDRIKSHFDGVADGVRRSEVASLWEQIKEEPLPAQRYDKTKGGRPPTPAESAGEEKADAIGEQTGRDIHAGKGLKPDPPKRPKRKRAKKA
jgi:hypothetical protein